MLFILLLLLPNIDSKLITYKFYQTNNICQHNWKGSICLPIFFLNQINHSLSIQLDINNQNHCLTRTLVYIRTRQCIYCAKNLHEIHCHHHHRRLRRMTPITKEHIHRNQIAIIFIGLLGILAIGSLLTLFFIKRSRAHTNLLDLLNPPSNPHSIKIPETIKTIPRHQSQPIRLPVPKKLKTTK